MTPSMSTVPSVNNAPPAGAERTESDHSESRNSAELPPPWKSVFKNDSWLKEVLDMGSASNGQDPIPCLCGIDLPRLWESKNGNLSAYLILLVSDYSGDIYFRNEHEMFFDSLHPHQFDEKHHEVTFEDSGIRLNIHDILVDQYEDGPRPIKTPEDLFGQEKDGSGVFTYVNYYDPDNPQWSGVTGPERVGPEHIQGIRGVPWNNKDAIKEMCVIQVKFRNNDPVTRMLRSWTVNTRIKGIYGGGQLVGFEKAGPDEEAINDKVIT